MLRLTWGGGLAGAIWGGVAPRVVGLTWTMIPGESYKESQIVSQNLRLQQPGSKTRHSAVFQTLLYCLHASPTSAQPQHGDCSDELLLIVNLEKHSSKQRNFNLNQITKQANYNNNNKYLAKLFKHSWIPPRKLFYFNMTFSLHHA